MLLVAAVVGFGVGRLQRTGQECAALPRGPVALTVRTTDPPDQRGRQPARAMAGCQGAVTLRVREPLPPGVKAMVQGSHAGRGVVAVREYQVMPGRAALIPRFRAAVARRIERLYGSRAPLVEALILGRKGDVDPALREAFAAAGLAHLLAISGLHVGLIASWVALLMGAIGGKRHAWAWAAVFAWVYVGTLGFPAPATRAAAFVTLLGLSRALGRHPPVSAILASGVLVVLLINPTAVTAIGAWLSVAAVWGTAQAARLVRGRNAVVRLFAVSVGATVATAPITAFGFGQVAVIGVAANLVAVPLAGIAVPGVFASLVLGTPLAVGAGLALAATERIALVAATVPGAQIVMASGFKAAIPWTALLVGVVWLLRVRPRMHWLLPRLAFGAAVLAWLPFTRPRVHASTSSELTVFFLNVGQGDAILLRTPNDRWLLIDAGPRDAAFDAGRDVVVPFLRRQRVRSLEAFFLSHGD
ncbi:MAG: ComEC/Rec2 family competence protein, partial [Gemmatimonadales bacterium]